MADIANKSFLCEFNRLVPGAHEMSEWGRYRLVFLGFLPAKASRTFCLIQVERLYGKSAVRSMLFSALSIAEIEMEFHSASVMTFVIG